MKVTCGHCGRKTEEGAFCEKCGAALAPAEQVSAPDGAVAAAAEPPSGKWRRATGDLAGEETGAADRGGGLGRGSGRPLLEVDRMCVQFEGLVGTVRFRLDPGAGEYETVKLTMADGEGKRRTTWGPRRFRERGEIRMQLDGQAAGCPTWTVRLECAKGGEKQCWEGDVDLVVARPREAQRVADNLKVEITNHITLGNASDAHVNQRALDGLDRLAAAENPFDVLKEVVCGSGRSWARVGLFETSADGDGWKLGPMPPGSRTDRVTLDFGTDRVHFFAGREMTVGRQRAEKGGSDIALRHPKAASLPPDSPELEPYLRASKRHCTILAGEGTVRVRNGCRGAGGAWEAPRSKLYWDAEAVEGERTLAEGASVTLTLGALGKGVQVEVSAVGERVCCPGCPDAERGRCGGGWRACAEVRRRDDAAERYVGLWGCYPLGRVDPMWGNVAIQRREGGFAWRRGGRCGWLEPGKDLATEFGTIKVK